MDLKKFGNFNWIEMDSISESEFERAKRIYFCPFQSIFNYWDEKDQTKYPKHVDYDQLLFLLRFSKNLLTF